MLNIRHSMRRAQAFVLGSRPWCLSFVQDGETVRWAIVEETMRGPVLMAHGWGADGAEAFARAKHVSDYARYVSTVFPGSATLYRYIQLPRLAPGDLRSALCDTLEHSLGIPVEESGVAFDSFPSGDESLGVSAYIAKNSAIESHLEKMGALSVTPEWVIPKGAALGAFISHFSFDDWHLVVDIDVTETNFVLAYRGRVIESRSLPSGSAVFSRLEEPSGDSDSDLKDTLQWLTETGTSFREGYGLGEDTPLTVTGAVVQYPLASPLVAECLGATLSSLHEVDRGDRPVRACASAIGAALCTCSRGGGSCPNFRHGELAFSKPLLHWKRALQVLATGCLAVTCSLIWYGTVRSGAIEAAVRDEWKRITVMAHAPVQDPGACGPSAQQCLIDGHKLLLQVEQRALFPLQPDIPRVREVLVWLTSLMTPTDAQEGITVHSLHYTMLKRPTKSLPKEHYQVRIDLEFSTPSVAMARSFHDSLLAPNPYIDGSAEVRWSQGNGRYRTSFLLKDKTKYPPL